MGTTAIAQMPAGTNPPQTQADVNMLDEARDYVELDNTFDDLTTDNDDFNIRATCDNKMKVFIDGKAIELKRQRRFNWKTLSQFSAGMDPKVIAIKCINTRKVGGILASGTRRKDGKLRALVTDKTWKCSNQWSANWTKAEFDVSTWAGANDITKNSVPRFEWFRFNSIRGWARWIWTDNYRSDGDTAVYCRATFDRLYANHSDCAEAGQTCHSDAHCVDDNGTLSCLCADGFSGDGVNACTDIDECDQGMNDCLSTQICENLEGGYTCDCVDGTATCDPDGPSATETKVPQCDQTKDQCPESKECVTTDLGETCQCLDELVADGAGGCKVDPDVLDVEPCQSNPCHNNAACISAGVDYTCDCTEDYEGKNCQLEVSPCNSIPCENNATCVKLDLDHYECQCSDGYEGSDCQFDIDECQSNPCLNEATCSDQLGGYACICPNGFEGDECERNVNPCSVRPCKNGGTCTDLISGYTCTCMDGYIGVNCEDDLDECISTPCQNGGTCNDYFNGYNCTCKAGYYGDECEIATFTQEIDSVCSLTGYKYNPDNNACEDIDECEDSSQYSCPDNSHCSNIEGAYECLCDTGYIQADDQCIKESVYRGDE